jgi:hypothetical protein
MLMHTHHIIHTCSVISIRPLDHNIASRWHACRYLFVRCDNSPAPWTSDEAGDAVRLEVPQLAAKEIKEAKGTVFEMADNPYW